MKPQPQPNISAVGEQQKIIRKGWTISGHAIHRAQSRWMEHDHAAAVAAIVRVLTEGESTRTQRGAMYMLGSRRVLVTRKRVRTVYVTGSGHVKQLSRLAWKDMKERRS